MSLATSLVAPQRQFQEERFVLVHVWEGAVYHGDTHDDRNVQW